MGCWDGTLLTLTGKEVAWSAVHGTSANEDGDAIQLATTQAMSMSVSIAHHCKSCHQMLCLDYTEDSHPTDCLILNSNV